MVFGRGKKSEVKEYSTVDEFTEWIEQRLGLIVVNRPDIKENEVIVDEYWVNKPYAKVFIVENKATGARRYVVGEAALSPREHRIYRALLNMIYYSAELPPKDVDIGEYFAKKIRETAFELSLRVRLPPETWGKIIYYVQRDTVGYGPLDAVMRDPYVEDIECNGPGKPVFVAHARHGNMPSNIIFRTHDELDGYVMNLVHKAGKTISRANPYVDATLPGGHRLAATYGTEISSEGSSFVIRKFKPKPLTILHLLADSRTLPPEVAAYLWILVENKLNFFTMGVTGAGKTTLLNALATLYPPDTRIVTVEEVRELKIPHENWVPLVTRPAALEGTGREITLYDLVKVSLRYRPDIIIVGEIRGEEAYTLFQALASVTGDTPILVRDKYGNVMLVSIGEFVDRFYGDGEEWVPKEVDGYEVLSHDGYNVVWKPIRYVLRHRADEVYEVEYEGGVIRATGSHSVFVLDPETLSIKTKRVDELAAGDLLLVLCGRGAGGVPYSVIAPGLVLDPGLAYVLGVYVRGGRVVEGGVVEFHLSSSAEAGEVKRIMAEKFSAEPVAEIRNGDKVVLVYRDGFVAAVFSSLFGDGSLPPELYSAPREVVGEFLRGLGDGSGSQRLAAEAAWLAALSGYRPGPRECSAPSVPAAALRRLLELSRVPGVPEHLAQALGDGGLVPAPVAEEVIRYAVEEGVIGGEAARIYGRLKAYLAGELAAAPVLRVTKRKYDGYVYDVSVPGTESFLGGAPPILLHNTGHGGASTLHANSFEDAARRLKQPPMSIPEGYIPLLNIAIVIRRLRGPEGYIRRITEIYEVESADKARIIWKWDPRTDSWTGRLEDSLHLNETIPNITGNTFEELLDEWRLRVKIIEKLTEQARQDPSLKQFENLSKKIMKFYRRRDEFLEELGITV